MSTVIRTWQAQSPSADASVPEGFIKQSFAGVKTFVRQGICATDSNEATGTVFVMLPAYNEAEGLPSLLMKIKSVFDANGRPTM